MRPELTAVEICETGRLAALADDWWSLWRRCPAATPFQSPAWLLAWWRAFAPGKLLVIAVRRRERLVGLAPLYLETGLRGRLLPLGAGVSDYLDILLDPEFAEAAGGAIMARLDKARLPWEALELFELAPEAASLRVRRPEGWVEQTRAASICPVLLLPRMGAAPDAVPPRMRRKLRMARHRAERRGTVTVMHADASSGPQMLAWLHDLHGRRWRARGERGVLDEQCLRFHELALPGLLKKGLARLYALAIDGRVAGVYYGLLHGTRAYAYLGGFDPDFAFESPGAILLGHAIEEAVHEGAEEFHFLRGQEAYKYRWGATDRCNRCRIFRRQAAHAEAS